jgi:Na+/melibiose symporter-like transporter
LPSFINPRPAIENKRWQELHISKVLTAPGRQHPVLQVVSGGCGVVSTVFMMCTVRRIGKRPLSLVCTAGSAMAALMLAVYALVEVAPQKAGEPLSATWAPLLLFILLSFCNGIVGQMPWMLLSEVFPFR